MKQTANECRSTADLAGIVDAFEAAWNDSGPATSVVDFLPDATHSNYWDIACELLCVDFERRWAAGERPTREGYEAEYPSLLMHARVRDQLALEAYRLESQEVTPEHRSATSLGSTVCAAEGSTIVEPGDGCPAGLPSVGDSFLGFEITEQLGECQFGGVFLARQPGLAHREVVLKLSTQHWSESDLLAKLQHAHIVPIYSVHQAGPWQAVCMPFLGRQTLNDVLRRGRQSDQPDAMADQLRAAVKRTDFVGEQAALWVAARLADGLAHAHGRGILHRDIKPANVLMSKDGAPMLLDFNLSQEVTTNRQSQTLVGGTLAYMSPEHLRAMLTQVNEIDERSDIYALGLILFEMLTGELPQRSADGSVFGTLTAAMGEELRDDVSPRHLNPHVAPATDQIVRRCLAWEPENRYASASELQLDLDRQLKNLPLVHAPDRSPVERTQKWLRRHPRIASGSKVAAIATVLVVVVSAVLWGRLQRANATSDFRDFLRLAQEARAPLMGFVADRTAIAQAKIKGEAGLRLFGIGAPSWNVERSLSYLSAEQREEIRRKAAEVCFLLAESSMSCAANSQSSMWDEAVTYNTAARSISGEASPAVMWRQWARLQRLQGHTQSAAETDARVRSMSTDKSRWEQFLTAVERYRLRDFQGAVELLLSMQREAPFDFCEELLWGHCQMARGNLTAAADAYTRCTVRWNDSHVAFFYRGVARYRAGQDDAAEADFSESLRLRPEQVSARLNRALARRKQRNWGGAEDDLTKAIALDPTNARAWLHRAETRAKLGRHADALHDQKAGLACTPVSELGWIDRALRQVEPERALADFQQALAINPRSSAALQNAASLLASELGRPEEAVEVLNRLSEVRPRDARVYIWRGEVHAALRKRADAVRDAHLAFQLEKTAETSFGMARIFSRTSRMFPSDVELSRRYMAEALRLRPDWLPRVQQSKETRWLIEDAKFQHVLAAIKTLQHTARIDDN